MLPSVGGGSSLRGFSSWRFRDRNSLLLQAEWRIMVNRFFDTAFFYDAGKVASSPKRSRPRRAEDDFGFGVRFHSPFTTPLRIEVARRQRRHLSRVLVIRGLLRRDHDDTRLPHVLVPHPADRCVHRGRRARSRPRTSRSTPRFYPDDPIARVPESQDASKAQRYEIEQMYEMVYNLFVEPGHQPSGVRAQNINTIDEVPDSSWFTNRIGTKADGADELVRGPDCRAPPDPSKWILIREKTSGAHPGFTARDAKGQTLFLEFDPPDYPEGHRRRRGRHQDLLGARLQPGRDLHHARSIRRCDVRSEGDDQAARLERGRRSAGRLNEILERAARAGRHVSRRRRAADYGQDPRQHPLYRHANGRPERPRPARASPRAACAARVRRLDEPDRPQGGQHARCARDRE